MGGVLIYQLWQERYRQHSQVRARQEIETVDQRLFEELGGKKTADKKEKLHTLKPE
jgi:hypothetical protein